MQFPYPTWHVNGCCHYADLVLVALLLRYYGCSCPVMSRSHHLTAGVLVVWLLQYFCPFYNAALQVLGTGVIDVLYRCINWHGSPMVSYSLHFDQLWFSVIDNFFSFDKG